MPHYHNFGWYYFVKYVLGFAGMLFLYSGFLKENKFSCICAAEAREIARRKGDNNESCPTGDRTDACVKWESKAPSHVDVDAKDKYPRPPMLEIRRRKLGRSVVSPRNVKTEYPSNRQLQVCRAKLTSLSSSDGNVEIGDRKRHRSGCPRASKHRRRRYRNSTIHDTSSQSSKSTPVCLHVAYNDNRRILDEVARANLRVRNSFAEQEHCELEAFACSIFNQEIFRDMPCIQGRHSPFSSSSSSIKLRATGKALRTGETDDENSSKSSSYSFESPEYRKVRRRISFRGCRKHFPESASSSFASIQSRSGSVYLTAASSRGQRAACKIHGCRCARNIEKSAKRLHRCRVIEESDESNDEIPFKSSINRRNVGKQRVTRYRSATVSML